MKSANINPNIQAAGTVAVTNVAPGCPTKLYIDEKEAAQMFSMSIAWFRKKRELGDGPPYFKDGWSVRYNVEQLSNWFEQRTKQSTSDYQSRFVERERCRREAEARMQACAGIRGNPIHSN